MKRRFKHNTNLIKELYGREFNIFSLLNENVNEADVNKITNLYIGHATRIKKNPSVKEVLSTDYAKRLLANTSLGQPDIKKIIELAIQIHKNREFNLGDKTTSNADNRDRQRLTIEVFEKFRDFKESEEDSNDNDMSGDESLSATKQNPKPEQKKTASGNSKIKELQKLIGHTPANGVWRGTNKTWAKWIESNKTKITGDIDIDLVKKNWKKATEAMHNAYPGTLSGMIKFVNDVKFGGAHLELQSQDDSTSEKDTDEDNTNPASDWTANRTLPTAKTEGNFIYFSKSAAKIKNLGDVLSGDTGTDAPGLPTYYVSSLAEFEAAGNSKDIFDSEVTKDSLNDYASDNLGKGGDGGFGGLQNDFIYDESTQTLYYDRVGFDNVKVKGKVVLTPDGKHLKFADNAVLPESKSRLGFERMLRLSGLLKEETINEIDLVPDAVKAGLFVKDNISDIQKLLGYNKKEDYWVASDLSKVKTIIGDITAKYESIDDLKSKLDAAMNSIDNVLTVALPFMSDEIFTPPPVVFKNITIAVAEKLGQEYANKLKTAIGKLLQKIVDKKGNSSLAKTVNSDYDGDASQMLAESKSRGQLYRERYFGRY